MKSKSTPVIFENKNGLQLFGILEQPETDTQSDVAIIILSPGVKNRVAPHRLYVKMAKKYIELGFTVLRFDFYGLGDSEGEIDEHYLADLYSSIQVGRYIDDTKSAMDWMEAEFNINKFILSGLCGGAISALHAAPNDNRVVGLLGLGIPVILDSSSYNRYQFITQGQLNRLRTKYIKKVFNFSAWFRFLTFQTDYKILIKSLLQTFKNNKKDNKDKNIKNTDNLNKENNSNFNTFFPEIFKSYASDRKTLLIFSETDRLYWEFEEKYMSKFKNEFESIKNNVQIEIVKQANHVFSFENWENDMHDFSSVWLSKYYID